MRLTPVLTTLALFLVPTLTAADVDRTTHMVFAGDSGAAGGDVNGDSLASAADLSSSVRGLRSPTEQGPYSVGVRRITFTKDSASSPGTPRPLRADIWYPTTPGTPLIDRTPGGLANAPLAPGVAALPLLLFSHGSCGFPGQSLRLTPLFASHGFIVVAPPHPGNTVSEVLTCGSGPAFTASFVDRPEDISFVIDEMLRLNEDSSSFFFGAVDPDRIGVSGHSFGGLTTFRVAAADPRIKAGLALAPALFDSVLGEVASIDVPMMVIGGTLDAVTPFEEDIRPSFELLGPPKYLAEITDTGHYAFSDLCVSGPGCEAGRLTQTETATYTARFAVPFLLERIAGDDSFAAFLEPTSAPPGVSLIATLE